MLSGIASGAALVIPDRSSDLSDLPSTVCNNQILLGDGNGYICADQAGAEAESITYAVLYGMQQAGQLEPLKWYTITDYQTTTGPVAGPVEPLTLQAITANTLGSRAYSSTYPSDILNYDINNIGDGATLGTIVYRQDPTKYITMHQDWRNIYVTLHETAPASGIYAYNSGAGDNQNFPQFNSTSLANGAYKHIYVGSTEDYYAKTVFLGDAQKIRIGPAQDWFICNDYCSDIISDSCISIEAYKTLNNVAFAGSTAYQGLVFKDHASALIFGPAVSGTSEGQLNNSYIYSTTTLALTGDHDGELIGYPPVTVIDEGGANEVTAAQLKTLTDNTSGTNTGDQDLTGLVHTNRTALDLVSGTNTGDQTLVSLGAEPAALFARVVGSDATTTGQSLVDITGLSLALEASSVYEFESFLTVNSSDTNGNKYGVNFSSAGASVSAAIQAPQTAGRYWVTGIITALNTATAAYCTGATNINGGLMIKGTLTTGANSGNLTVQHLKVTSGTSTVYVGSYVKAIKR